MILVVEHDPMIRTLMMEFLQGEGYACLPARDLRDAMKRLDRDMSAVHMLIVDRMLPDGDGLELIHAARRQRPDIPVILTCGYHRAPDRNEHVEFLPKPFRLTRLAATVARHCSDHAMAGARQR